MVDCCFIAFCEEERRGRLKTVASVLVVEDEPIASLDLQQGVEEMGYTVAGVADTAEGAIAAAQARRPDVVLMDIRLRGEQDGTHAAQRIGRTLHVPVIFLTAYSDAETVRRVAQAAPYGFLTKPFRANELRAAIEVALYKASLERRLRESEQWFAATLRCVGDGIVACDETAKVTFMNPAAEALTGWSLDQARGRGVEDIVPLLAADGSSVVANPLKRALAEDRVVGIEFGSRLLARDGQQRPIDDSAAPIRAEGGELLGGVLAIRDVSERVRMEEQLRSSEERFRNAFELAGSGMAMVALDGRFLQINDAFCQTLGYERADLLARDHFAVTVPEDWEKEQAQLHPLLMGQAPVCQYEKRYRHREDKRIVWAMVSVSLLSENGRPLCYLYQIYDETERKRTEYELERLAYIDPLTDLGNRGYLRRELERQIAEARRHRWQLALLLIDLDRFKQINDTLGHEMGDELLRTVGNRLRGVLRESDRVARLGGDEFVLALPGLRGPADVLTVAEHVRQVICEPISLGGQEFVVTPSMGVSLFPTDGEDIQTLMRNADTALYAAKAQGRNRVYFFRPELGRAADQQLEMETALRRALGQDELFLQYQPIVRLHDGAIVACEALLRWRRDGETVAPGAFIPLAVETGLIIPISAWVLREACWAAAAWPSGVQLHVNCSERQFREDSFAASIAAVLRETDLPAERLCLELTEDVILQPSELQSARLRQLRDIGVSLSIDDYGTGYSSLAYLKRYSPRSLKLDKLFVGELASDSSSQAIVSATLAMAHELGLKTVAEGVETAAQLAYLRAEDCDMAQGFYFSKPVAGDALASLFKAGRLPIAH